MYIAYLLILAKMRPKQAPLPMTSNGSPAFVEWLNTSNIINCGGIGFYFGNAATPTEAAGVGALGATLLAATKGELNKQRLTEVGRSSLETTCMVFMILIGATVFSLVFRGFGGEEVIHHLFQQIPGGVIGAMAIVLVIFPLGFILDFIEITFIVVPIVGPILLTMGLDPVWLGIMIAINLQTFLTPPFGFALFYLRGVAPNSVKTGIFIAEFCLCIDSTTSTRHDCTMAIFVAGLAELLKQ